MKNRIFSVFLCLLLVAATTLPALSPIITPVEVEAGRADAFIPDYECTTAIFSASFINGYFNKVFNITTGSWWTSNPADNIGDWAHNASCSYDSPSNTLKLSGTNAKIRFHLNDLILASGGASQAQSRYNAIRLIYRSIDCSGVTYNVHSSGGTTATGTIGFNADGAIRNGDSPYPIITYSGNLDCVTFEYSGTWYLYAIQLFIAHEPGNTNYMNNDAFKFNLAVRTTYNLNGGTLDGHTGTYVGPYEALYPTDGTNTVAFTLADAPSRTGYRFSTWRDGNGTEIGARGSLLLHAPSFGANIDYSTTAQWTPNHYTVYYNANGGSGTTNATGHDYGTNSSLATNGFTKTGYSFAGWYDAANGGTKIPSADSLVSTDNGSITLYAHWTPNTYTVTYHGNGASGTTNNTTHTYDNAGNLATENFSDPTGYHFGGWKWSSTGNSANYSNGQSVTNIATGGTVTLYAHWVPNTYTVSFDSQGGSSVSSRNVTYDAKYGTLSTPTAPTGYTFAGWYTAANGGSKITSDTTVKTASNHTLYAQWAANEYTVSFDPNGGSVAPSSQTAIYNSTYGDLPTLMRAGYAFNGWFTEKSGGTQVTRDTKVTTVANHTLYAQWTPVNYTLTFNGNGVTNPDNIGYTIESTDKLPTLVRDGYTFNGWKPTSSVGSWDANETYAGGTSLTDKHGSVELVAQWTPITYTVTLNENGGGDVENVTYTIEDTVNLPLPTRVGYTFGGWKVTTASGNWALDALYETGNLSIAAGKYGNVTLTAQWTANTYTITYDEKGYTLPAESPTSYTYGVETPLPTPTRPGFDFLGWKVMSLALDATGWTLDATVTAVPNGATGAVTLTAQWESRGVPVHYQLQLPAGAPPSTGSLTYTEDYVDALNGMAVTGSAIDTLNDGYAFKGWYTNPECTEPAPANWVDASGKLLVDIRDVDPAEWPASYTFYAKVDYDTKVITLAAECTENPEQTFIYRITGTPVLTSVFGETTSVEVTLLSGESVQVVMPLGDYIVTEYTDWSWRYTDTEDPEGDQTEDVERDKEIISRYDAAAELLFTYGTPTNPLWLNSYSVIAGPGKETEITS